jgi:hypothetical protein
VLALGDAGELDETCRPEIEIRFARLQPREALAQDRRSHDRRAGDVARRRRRHRSPGNVAASAFGRDSRGMAWLPSCEGHATHDPPAPPSPGSANGDPDRPSGPCPPDGANPGLSRRGGRRIAAQSGGGTIPSRRFRRGRGRRRFGGGGSVFAFAVCGPAATAGLTAKGQRTVAAPA